MVISSYFMFIDVEKYSTIKPYHGTIFKFSTEDGITQSHDLYFFDMKYTDENIQKEFDETEIPTRFNMDGFNVIITWLMVLMSLSVLLGLVFASVCILITGLVGNILLLGARNNTFLEKVYFKRINKKIDREYALLLDNISLDLAYDNGIDLDDQKNQLKKYGLLYLNQY